MGIQDRDYYRTPPPSRGLGALNDLSVNTWLIVINVAVFLVNLLAVTNSGTIYERHPIEEFGYFSVATAIFHGQIWRFLTFQFLHAGIQHIAFNMIALYFFGPLVEQMLGRWRYLAFYLLCGFAGPVMYLLLWAMHVLVYDPNSELIGASAGIFGVLIAGAEIAPNATVLFWGIVPMRFRVLAWGMIAYAAYTVLFNGGALHGYASHNAGGEAGHLGGAAAGYLLIKNVRLLDFADFKRGPKMRYRR